MMTMAYRRHPGVSPQALPSTSTMKYPRQCFFRSQKICLTEMDWIGSILSRGRIRDQYVPRLKVKCLYAVQPRLTDQERYVWKPRTHVTKTTESSPHHPRLPSTPSWDGARRSLHARAASGHRCTTVSSGQPHPRGPTGPGDHPNISL